METTICFVDSTSLLDDPVSLRARFAHDGYAFFAQLLDPAKVRRVRTEVLAALAPLGWLAPGSRPQDALPAAAARREAKGDWFDGYAAIQALESFHALAHDPALLGVARALCASAQLLVHPRKIARVTYPGSEYPTPPHQDFPLIQGAADTFTTWVPLGDCPSTLGGLQVLAGSAAQGLRRMVSRPGAGIIDAGVDTDISEQDTRWAGIDYRAGDVLAFHSFSIHWAPPNRGSTLRLSADYRYQAADAPVSEGSLLPHYHGSIPGWDELTRGWATTAWVDRPETVRLADFRDPFGDLGRPNSAVLAERQAPVTPLQGR